MFPWMLTGSDAVVLLDAQRSHYYYYCNDYYYYFKQQNFNSFYHYSCFASLSVSPWHCHQGLAHGGTWGF